MHTLMLSSNLVTSCLTFFYSVPVVNVNQGELWDHIFVLLDRKEKRERGSRGNGCFGKKRNEEGRRGDKNVEEVDNKK